MYSYHAPNIVHIQTQTIFVVDEHESYRPFTMLEIQT